MPKKFNRTPKLVMKFGEEVAQLYTAINPADSFAVDRIPFLTLEAICDSTVQNGLARIVLTSTTAEISYALCDRFMPDFLDVIQSDGAVVFERILQHWNTHPEFLSVERVEVMLAKMEDSMNQLIGNNKAKFVLHRLFCLILGCEKNSGISFTPLRPVPEPRLVDRLFGMMLDRQRIQPMPVISDYNGSFAYQILSRACIAADLMNPEGRYSLRLLVFFLPCVGEKLRKDGLEDDRQMLIDILSEKARGAFILANCLQVISPMFIRKMLSMLILGRVPEIMRCQSGKLFLNELFTVLSKHDSLKKFSLSLYEEAFANPIECLECRSGMASLLVAHPQLQDTFIEDLVRPSLVSPDDLSTIWNDQSLGSKLLGRALLKFKPEIAAQLGEEPLTPAEKAAKKAEAEAAAPAAAAQAATATEVVTEATELMAVETPATEEPKPEKPKKLNKRAKRRLLAAQAAEEAAKKASGKHAREEKKKGKKKKKDKRARRDADDDE
eukprot:gnl/Trimastix_PCT/276.p1 GENE.gnl/Trimastix_PCT/276~~gnl/Trimastix_PCT/276.p1  ORF type:complete len:517 (-),score=140.48 gnl/Trimastix_PCT/276:54-1541(-)